MHKFSNNCVICGILKDSAKILQVLQKIPNLEEFKRNVEKEYNDVLKNVPKGALEHITNWIIYWSNKDNQELRKFLNKHPDSITLQSNIQKIFSKIKVEETTLEEIEILLYGSGESEKDVSKINPSKFKIMIDDVPGKMKWVMLIDAKGKPKNECKGEAKALSHCGQGSELMFSLRDNLGHSIATADLSKSGNLNQLKFDHNNTLEKSENKRYEPAVEALLNSEYIKNVMTRDLPWEFVFKNKKFRNKESIGTAIKTNKDNYKLIEGPSEQEWMWILEANGMLLKDVKNPTKKMIMSAVQNNGNAIKFVKVDKYGEDFQNLVQVAAVSNSPSSILEMKNPSEELMLTAIKKDKEMVEKIAVKFGGNLSEKAMEIIIDEDVRYFGHVLDSQKVPDRLVMKAFEMHPKLIVHIENPTREMQLKAYETDPFSIHFIDKDKLIPELKDK